jgi:catechol 2,3-dioxygenase-like lactoylglutathione lyase family enzyme
MVIAGGCATLPVADFDRAIGFYTETLGLTLIVRFGDEWACLDAGEGMLIGLIPSSDDQDNGTVRIGGRRPPSARSLRR